MESPRSGEAAGGGQEELYERLKAYEGRPATVAGVGKDLVNEPMIRHWCEAMGDTNPAYRGPDAIAPPTMLQAWTMGGLSGHTDRSAAQDELFALLDGAGYTSVVATDCEQEYLRPLRPGDRITFDAVIESVSGRKTTKLGTGHFVTTRMDIAANGEPAGTHRFRILKYAPRGTSSEGRLSGGRPSEEGPSGGKPSAKKSSAASGSFGASGSSGSPMGKPSTGRSDTDRRAAGRSPTDAGAAQEQRPVAPGAVAKRPRPVINRDNAGFWDGVAERRLLIQRCQDCASLRFPWLPGCRTCGAPEWDTVEASGAGIIYSFVVSHHPPFPAFDPPYAVGLIELAEGVRIVAGVTGVPYDKVRIGMPVELEFLRVDEDLTVPVFRATGVPGASGLTDTGGTSAGAGAGAGADGDTAGTDTDTGGGARAGMSAGKGGGEG
ncbi:bifunctional MaoC family dehydratase N-terminal/OB-fold nucleic acid binding domain-containing protein [Streptomyces sp. NPDC051018]|uniref:bifunctional MaoC family dehydratase N-terminal/OB-fold nucleic acid binding domain-containing protein n=1 Tax=Streptomyces sp. NPDC051018 TaxID=3365639 RepID=UPI0037AC9625